MPSIKFEAVVETTKAIAGIKSIQDAVHQTSEQVKQDGDAIDDVVNKIKNGAMAIAGSWTASELVQKIMQVRGQFQQLEIAFTTMLGSGEKANELMNQLVETAAITPFDLQGVAEGAKQLMAYGTSADEVNDILVHLGDIAAGMSLPLSDLVYLYGTTMAQGQMLTMDLRQFQGRGIPIAAELAKQFGVAENKVKDLVSAGKVGSEEFNKAIMAMSSEGGKFGGLMKEQSKSITGQISNIEDAVDVMFNNIGKQNEGIINKGLGVVSELVENYERVGRTLLALAAAYGTYKAALIAVNVVQKISIALCQQAVLQQKLAAMQGIVLSEAQAMAAAKTTLLSAAFNKLKVAMLSNPWTLVATAIAGVVALLVSQKTETERVKEAEERYAEQKEEVIKKEREHQEEIDNLLSVAQDEEAATEYRKQALVRLAQEYPTIFAKYKTEVEWLRNIREIKKEIAELDGKTSAGNAKNELNTVEKRIGQLEAKAKTKYTYQKKIRPGVTETKTEGGLSMDEEAELKALKKKQASLKKFIQKYTTDAFYADLSGVSDEQLKKYIKRHKAILSQMDLDSKKKYGRVNYGGAKGVFSEDELRGQLNIMQTELEGRENAKTPQDYVSSLAKDLKKAEKALADFDKSTKKMTAAEIEEKRSKLVQEVEAAKKAYKNAGGGGSTSKKTTTKTTTKDDTAEEKVKAEEDLNETLHTIQQENAEDELALQKETTEKKLKQIKEDYEKRKAEIEKYEAKLKENNKKATGKEDLTEEQQNAINEAKRLAAKKKSDETEAVTKEQQQKEIDALNDYLKQYGSYQDKRLAIKQLYDQKIADAETMGEKFSLQSQRDKELDDLAYQNFNESMDWQSIFSGLDTVSLQYLQDLKTKLQEMLSADDITPGIANDLQSRLDEIDAQIISKKKEWKSVFSLAIPELEKQNELERKAADDQERATQALEKYVQALKQVDDTKSEIAQFLGANGITVSAENINLQGSQEKVSQLQGQNVDPQAIQNIVQAYMKLASQTQAASAAGAASSAAASSAASSAGAAGASGGGGGAASTAAVVDAIVNGINQNVQSTVDVLEDLELDDTTFGKGFNNFAKSSQYAADAWNSLKQGNIAGVAHGVIGSLQTLGDALGSWGLGMFGSSDSTLQEDMQRLAQTNEALEEAINDLADQMEDSSVPEATEIYEKQLSYLKEQEANNRNLMQRNAVEHNNGFLGMFGKHSSAYKIDKEFGAENWQTLTKLLGKRVASAADFFVLSSYEMWRVATEAPELYARIKDLADDGSSDAAQYMDAYKDSWQEIEELQEQFYEKATSLSFDTLQSDFADALLDMDNDAEDFANDFEGYLRNAIINAIVSEQYAPLLENWRKALAYYMADGELTEDELKALRETGGSYTNEATGKEEYFEGWNTMTERALRDRDVLNQLGIAESSSQEASSKGWESMGQDTAEELNGRFTALQIAGESVAQNMAEAVAQMQSLATVGISTNGAVLDMRNMMVMTNSYLEDMVKYSKLTYSDFGSKLDAVYKRLTEI